MSLRFASLVATAAMVAACDGGPATEPAAPVGSGGPVGANADTTAEVVSPLEAGDLPRPGEGLRFVGKWAADQRSCETVAWQFTETTLRTPAGSACSFNRVTEVPGGFDIQATCTAEAPPTSDTLKVRFSESAKALLFESETIADAGLVFCGRDS